MADLSDIEIALVNAVIEALYPEGLAGPSVCGGPVRVYRGWPVTGALNTDLQFGTSNVSVFPVPGSTRNTTRWPIVGTVVAGITTLTAQAVGDSATFAGEGGAGQVAGLLVDGQTFAYRMTASDTPSLVAAVLADAVKTTRTCWLSGPTITIPGAHRLDVRVVADGQTAAELGRQVQEFRISAWCSNPIARDRTCSTLSSAFASTAFIALADGSSGRLTYRSTLSIDEGQDAQLYRRDLLYEVEYGTFATTTAPAMLFGELTWASDTIFA